MGASFLIEEIKTIYTQNKYNKNGTNIKNS